MPSTAPLAKPDQVGFIGPMLVRPATPADLPRIADIQRHDSNALGWLPYAAIADKIRRRRALVLTLDAGVEAYLIHGPVTLTARVWQLATARPHRRRTVATALLDALRFNPSTLFVPHLLARCAEDLEANAFWISIGARLLDQRRTNNARRRLLNEWSIDPPSAIDRSPPVG